MRDHSNKEAVECDHGWFSLHSDGNISNKIEAIIFYSFLKPSNLSLNGNQGHFNNEAIQSVSH